MKAFDTMDRASMTLPTALPGGRFVSKFPLAFVISYAYKLPFNRPSGFRESLDALGRTMYDIQATGTMPGGLSAQARDDRMRLMLQTLLADRFKMVMHKEHLRKEMPVYALVVGKGGPKLEKRQTSEKTIARTPSLAPFAPGPGDFDPEICHGFNGGQGRGPRTAP